MNSAYRDAYEFARATLADAGVDEARLEARLLLEYVCHTTRNDLYAHPDRELTRKEQETLDALLKRREKREPLSYLTREREFMGLRFVCAPRALIPRQDTETLVEEAMPHLFDGMRFLDLCAGTGCVALSLLKYSNDTTAVATEIDQTAADVARQNADVLGLSDRIEIAVCDLFPPEEATPENGFDLIVSNPPYIRTEEIETLQAEVRDYEPRIALDGGADGLTFYRRIAAQAGNYLARGGRLFVEIGCDQESDVRALFENAGFRDVTVARDLNGRPRVVSGSYIKDHA